MSPARKKSTKKAASRKTSARGKTAGRKKASRGAPKKKKTPTRKKAGSTRKTAKKKSVTKKPATKKTAKKKPATRKVAAKKVARRQEPPAAQATPEKRAARKSAGARAAAAAKSDDGKQATRPAVPPPDAHPKLGVKHTCFRCGAKFYDLFRPEPLCPKCGADQREAPKLPPRPKPMPLRKTPSKRVMTPLLDDEDEDLLFDDDKDTGLDLEAAGAELDDPTDLNDEDVDL